MKEKTKKILIIALSIMLVGVVGAMGAIFGKSDWAKVKDKVKDLTQQEEVVDSKNLVANSDFSINTTGVTLFNETTNAENHSTLVDDWRFVSHASDRSTIDFTAYQTKDGFYVRNDGTDSIYLMQRLDENTTKYANKEMTLTFSADGVVYSATGVLTADNAISVSSSGKEVAVVGISLQYNEFGVNISFASGANVTINWIQVEEGNVFTGYIPEVETLEK